MVSKIPLFRDRGEGPIGLFGLTRLFQTVAILLIGLAATGCRNTAVTNTPRSATEQLLLSTAADRAVASARLAELANKKVFVDTNYFEGYDAKYALGTIRDALSRAGALLVAEVKESEIIVEARSGSLAIDSTESLLGLPKMPFPVPGSGTLETPELAIFKAQRQQSISKIALLAYANDSRKHLFSSGPLVGKAYNNKYKFFFIPFTSTDVPEKQRERKPRKR